MISSTLNFRELWKPVIITLALLFLYATVLTKLSYDWWNDDNYSHGLLVPLVIGYIVWLKFDDLRNTQRQSLTWPGFAIVLVALAMLLAGTLGAELFTQRLSLAVMLAGVVIYFFGMRVLRELAVPFFLLILAIPIPQIIFNKIAFPLQLLASKISAWAIGLLDIPFVRNGNVIQIEQAGTGNIIALEVVEACSGIRSLMTLVTLALILGYLTADRRRAVGEKFFGLVGDFDFWRTVILMVSAVPIALLTNSGRVTSTAILAYYYGPQAAEGALHESAGALVFVLALGILIALNHVLRRFSPGAAVPFVRPGSSATLFHRSAVTTAQTVALFTALLTGGVFINWFEHRGEVEAPRRPLSEIPAALGEWQHKGGDFRFDEDTEKVLKADDYVMRYYVSPEAWINFYVGFYGSQRTGATYHSPQNCLPGTGWEMKDPGRVEIKTLSGRTFVANRYTVQRGNDRQLLIYWYQGRGRSTASEYEDKLYTSLDSLTSRRSDGAIVRMMIPIWQDEQKSLAMLLDFASHVGDELSPFVPN